jgi:small-conductance mechanosensitive channel
MLPPHAPTSRRAAGLLALLLLLASARDAAPQTKALLEAARGASQPPTSTAAPAPDPRAELEARRAAVEQELAALRERAAAAEPSTAPLLLTEGALLEEELGALGRQLEALARADELARLQRETDERSAAGPAGAVPHPPPYTLADLDAASDARDAAAGRVQALADAVRAAEEALSAASEQLERSEQARRQARESAESEKDEAIAARLRDASRKAQLESRAAQAQRELASLQLENTRRDLELVRATEAGLREAVEWLRGRIGGDRGPLREQIAALDQHEVDLTRRLEKARRELELAEQRLALAQKRLEAAPSPDPALAAEVEARRTERDLAGRRIGGYQALLQRVAPRRELWERRFDVLVRSPRQRELRELATELEQQAAERARETRLMQARLAEVEQEAGEARARADSDQAAAAPGAAWQQRRAQAIADWLAEARDLAGDLEAEHRLAVRTLEEVRAQSTGAGLLAGLRGFGERAGDLWRFELVAVQDSSITVGKVAGAVLLFAVGILVARVTSRLIGRALRHRAHYDPGAASAVQHLVFYVLSALVLLLALRTVNIPLTAFTVIGGALALGVGFGSQNVVANFISGLILMAERPIKEGDLIEVDGTRGTVERIGPRSTRVRIFDNTHLIVPNSVFLEKNVRNFTLTDDDIRATVSVGVAYGSPTREVERMLLRAVHEHGKVLEFPEPTVFFVEFGDNALIFRAYFWLRSRDMAERYGIESDVRHAIDALLREAGIAIAFPQRDVHLDVSRPVAVQLLPPAPPGPDA